MTVPADPGEGKYRSRTLWIVILTTVTATALVLHGDIDGGSWTTTILGLFAGWQARRYGDNKLRNGKAGQQ